MIQGRQVEGRPRAEGFALIGLGAGARLVGFAAGALAGLVTTAVAVRLLGTDDYGVLAFSFSTAALFAGIGRLGLEPAVARSTAIMRVTNDRARMADVARGAVSLVGVTGIIGTVGTLIVLEFASGDLDGTTRITLAALLGVLLYGSNVTAVGAAIARGNGRVALMEMSILAPALSKLAAVAIVAALDLANIRWVAAGYAIGAAAGITVAWRTTNLVLGRQRAFVPDAAAARAVLRESLPFAVVGLSVIVISRLDVVILGLTGTAAEVGQYEPTVKLVEQTMLMAAFVFTAQFLPVASRAFDTGQTGEFRELYIVVSKVEFLIAAPAVIVLAAFPEEILQTVYGADFPASGAVVWLLLPGFVVNLVFGLNSSALSAVGDRRALARTGIVATVAMVLLAIALVPPFGPEGAAAATSGTYVILNLVVAFALLRTAKVQPFRRDYVVTLLTWLVPLGAAIAVRASGDVTNVWEAIGVALGVSIVWVVLLFPLRALHRDEIVRLLPWQR